MRGMTPRQQAAYQTLRHAHAHILNRRYPNLTYFIRSGAGLHAAFLLGRAMGVLLGLETAEDVRNWKLDLNRIVPGTKRD
jgi:hypothetical protein